MLDELGTYKEIVDKYFKDSTDICNLLLGKGCEELDEFTDEFDKYVNNALYVPDTVTKVKSYLCYDVNPLNLGTTIKDLKITIYALAHKDYINNFNDIPIDLRKRLRGNRADKLAQAIENILMDDNRTINFGIGKLEELAPDYYNSEKFYGRVLYFKVPNFR